jgi:hypothetical protein
VKALDKKEIIKTIPFWHRLSLAIMPEWNPNIKLVEGRSSHLPCKPKIVVEAGNSLTRISVPVGMNVAKGKSAKKKVG